MLPEHAGVSVNLPNRITLGRLVLAAALFATLELWCRDSEGTGWYVCFGLFIALVISDGLDGYIARSRNQITSFGRIADPFADKILIGGTLVMLTTLPPTRDLAPAWFVILVLAREFLVSGLRGYLEGRGVKFAARWEGKAKLVIQAVFCSTLLLYPGGRFEWTLTLAKIGLPVTALVTVWSAISYVRKAAEELGRQDV